MEVYFLILFCLLAFPPGIISTWPSRQKCLYTIKKWRFFSISLLFYFFTLLSSCHTLIITTTATTTNLQPLNGDPFASLNLYLSMFQPLIVVRLALAQSTFLWPGDQSFNNAMLIVADLKGDAYIIDFLKKCWWKFSCKSFKTNKEDIYHSQISVFVG